MMLRDPSGKWYDHARWYDAQQGRFMTEDPTQEAGGLNVFTTDGNDPINNIDLSGMDSQPNYASGGSGFPRLCSTLTCDPANTPQFSADQLSRLNAFFDGTGQEADVAILHLGAGTNDHTNPTPVILDPFTLEIQPAMSVPVTSARPIHIYTAVTDRPVRSDDPMYDGMTQEELREGFANAGNFLGNAIGGIGDVLTNAKTQGPVGKAGLYGRITGRGHGH